MEIDGDKILKKIEKAPILDNIESFTFLNAKTKEKRTYQRVPEGWKALWNGEIVKDELIIKIVYLASKNEEGFSVIKKGGKKEGEG